jgi:hypothetical protein
MLPGAGNLLVGGGAKAAFIGGTVGSNVAVVNLPAGVIDGDLMVAFGYRSNSSIPSTPSGWTLIASAADSTGNTQALAIWQRTASGQGASVALAGDVAGVAVFRKATGIDVHSGIQFYNNDGATDSTITLPSVNPVRSGHLIAVVCQDFLNVYENPDFVNNSDMALIGSAGQPDFIGDYSAYLLQKSQFSGATGNKQFIGYPESGSFPDMAGILLQVY